MMQVKQQGSATIEIESPLGRAKLIVWSLPPLRRSWRSKSKNYARPAMQREEADLRSCELVHAPSLHWLQLRSGFAQNHISRDLLYPSQRAQRHDSVLDNAALLKILSDLNLYNDRTQGKPMIVFFLQYRTHAQSKPDNTDLVRHPRSIPQDIKHKGRDFEVKE